MAFVSETQRQLNPVPKLINPLGPGQYYNEEAAFSHQRKSPAPFHSTNNRKSIFEQNRKVMPGPCDYDPAKPFIEPNIKTISNSQSIIVKINSMGTSPFKSVCNRFDGKSSEDPGPGQYHYGTFPKKKRSTSNSYIKDPKISDKIKSMIETKPHYPTIPEKVRGLTDAKTEQPSDRERVGPGAYESDIKHHVNLTSTCWGKDRTRRFSLDGKHEVGPGKYNAEFNPVRPEDKVRQPSHSFKSSTVRTYFDSLIYKTNLDETAQMRIKSNYKSKDPAPGQYDPNLTAISLKEKPFSFQFFGSTVERFPDEETERPKHKSYYNIKSEIGQNRSFNKLSHSFLCAQSRDPSFLQVKQQEATVPGPGHYPEKVKVEKKLRGMNLQQFGTTTKRPFYEKEQVSQMGPGKYYKEASEEDNIQASKFGQVKDISANFKSSTTRNCFGTNQNENPFAEYDVSHYDLSKKMEKQRNFIENLKKIDVDKAPFESTISRFPHYEAKKPASEINKFEQAKNAELKIKQEAERVRAMMIQANRSQVTQKIQNSVFAKEQRFSASKRGAPGVGHYPVSSNWQKKSHNIKYQQK